MLSFTWPPERTLGVRASTSRETLKGHDVSSPQLEQVGSAGFCSLVREQSHLTVAPTAPRSEKLNCCSNKQALTTQLSGCRRSTAEEALRGWTTSLPGLNGGRSSRWLEMARPRSVPRSWMMSCPP